jgi:hypothetical protein
VKIKLGMYSGLPRDGGYDERNALPNRNISVGKAAGYELDSRKIRLSFSAGEPSDRLWGSGGYRGLFPRGKAASVVKLATHFHLITKLRMPGGISPLHISSWQKTNLSTGLAVAFFTFKNG